MKKKMQAEMKNEAIRPDAMGICPNCGRLHGIKITDYGIDLYPIMGDSDTDTDKTKYDASKVQNLNLRDIEFGISEATIGLIIKCTECNDADNPGRIHFITNTGLEANGKSYLKFVYALRDLVKALNNANMVKTRTNLSLEEFNSAGEYKMSIYSYGIKPSEIIFTSFEDSLGFFYKSTGEVVMPEPKINIDNMNIGMTRFDITFARHFVLDSGLTIYEDTADWIKEFTKCLEKNTKKAYTKRGRISKKEK